MQGTSGGNAGGAAGALQNPKVLVGIVAAVAVVVIALIVMFVVPRSSAQMSVTPAAGLEDAGATGPGIPGGGTGTTTMPMTGPPGGMGGMSSPGMMSGGYGGGMMGGGAGAGGMQLPEGESEAPVSRPPGVPTRRNPFAENTELRQVIASIPPDPEAPSIDAPAHHLWQELNPPQPSDPAADAVGGGPAVPAMRLSGVIIGHQVSALLDLNGEHLHITPGKMIPEENPVFRVESIERDKAILTRRWEMGGRKGVQRIEVIQSGQPGGPIAGFGSGVDFGS
jgi:hypothetical protein